MTNNEAALFRDKQIGFFIYLGVEAVMFLTLFATYIIFTPAPVDPKPGDIFEVKSLVLSSVFLLASSGTLIIAEKGFSSRNVTQLRTWLGITLAFGVVFLGLEINEFYGFVQLGYGTSKNVFLGSYYVLVGLHAAHVTFGAGWMIMLFAHHFRKVPRDMFYERLKIFSYYWHFVDIIWIFIIVIVYLPYIF